MADTNKPAPDFLCIGMQKGGTRWIYDAMSQMPGALMPPIKEFNHFAAMFGHKGSYYDVGKVFRRQLRRLDQTHARVPEDLRARFRAAVGRYIVSGSHEDYLDLFGMSQGLVTGDVSPAYSLLTGPEVREVRAVLPEARIVLTVRHPVSRVWSHFNMHLRLAMKREGIPKGGHQAEIVKRASPRAFRAFLKTDRVDALSRASEMYDLWQEVFGEVMVFDFNEIVTRPAAVAARLSQELVGRPMREDEAPQIVNAKEKAAKAQMLPRHAEIAYTHFADEIRRCQGRFGFAAAWQTEPDMAPAGG